MRPVTVNSVWVLDVLDALLDPRLLVGIGDVHELDADLAAIGLAQALHDLAQRRGFTQRQRAEYQDRAVPVGFAEAVGRGIEFAMRRLAHETERVEVGLEMAADAVGADQHQRPRRVLRRRADLFLGLSGNRRRGSSGPLAALDVAVGCGRNRVGIDRADHPGAIGRPGRATHLGEHIALLLGQGAEEGLPLASTDDGSARNFA